MAVIVFNFSNLNNKKKRLWIQHRRGGLFTCVYQINKMAIILTWDSSFIVEQVKKRKYQDLWQGIPGNFPLPIPSSISNHHKLECLLDWQDRREGLGFEKVLWRLSGPVDTISWLVVLFAVRLCTRYWPRAARVTKSRHLQLGCAISYFFHLKALEPKHLPSFSFPLLLYH